MQQLIAAVDPAQAETAKPPESSAAVVVQLSKSRQQLLDSFWARQAVLGLYTKVAGFPGSFDSGRVGNDVSRLRVLHGGVHGGARRGLRRRASGIAVLRAHRPPGPRWSGHEGPNGQGHCRPQHGAAAEEAGGRWRHLKFRQNCKINYVSEEIRGAEYNSIRH